MRRLLLLIVVAQSAFSADLAITSAVYSNKSFILAWPREVATDPDLIRVIDVDRRQVLTQGSWESIATENLSGIFTDTTPPERSGFYQLKDSEYPLALIGPDASSSSLGIRLLSPERADVLFFRPPSANSPISPNTADSLTVVVNGGYRATIFFSPDRTGLQFRYDVAGSSLKEILTLNRGEARLTTPEYLRAKSAAMRGTDAAQSLLADLFRRYPDSATVWQDIGSGQAAGTNNEATVLYVRADAADIEQGASPAQFGEDIELMAQPMVSGSTLVPLSEIATAMPFDSENVGSNELVNLNATNDTQTDPWIGLRSTANQGAPVAAAKWIYVGENGGPTNATNPPVARYAYWIEDESFKVNLNVATNGLRGTNAGTHPEQITMDGLLAASTNLNVYINRTSALLQRRAELRPDGFPSVAAAADALEIENELERAELRFSATVHSAGLDLSRGGFRRFNINSITNKISGPTDAINIRTNLDRIITAITNNNSAPNLGQRFYRLGTNEADVNAPYAVTAEHANIYLQKIAANLLDYIDGDDQPTVISNDSSFSLVNGRPTVGILPVGGGTAGTNPIAAMGVENVPRLQEYAIHLRVRKMKWDPANPDSFGFVFNTSAGASNPTSAQYEVWLDHYFEFWNPGTRDFTNSADTFLKIFDQPAWGPGSGGGVVTGNAGRGSGDFTTNNRASSEIPLIDALTGQPVVFPAGEVTVVTTAPLDALNTGASSADFLVVTPNPNALVPLRVPAADRVFTGTTSSILVTNYDYQAGAAALGGGPYFGYNRLFEVAMQFGRPGGTGNTDYASGVLIGNDEGIIESHVGLPIGATNASSGFSAIVASSWNRNDLSHVAGNILNGQIDNVRGGSLRGNSTGALTKPSPREGDPRSLLEQLELNIYSPGGGFDQTRFYNTMGPGSGSTTFVNSTFGRPNANYVFPINWTDSSSINPGASNAPLFVRNGAMQSIGELGHITDPARPYITSGSVPLLARGGGRTLRIGQSELTNSGGTNIAWYDRNQTSASRTWTSWRLTDIFTTKTNLSVAGLINPNGSFRDRGAAFRSLLYGLRFLPSPEGAPNIANRPANVNNLVTAVLTRMTNLTGSGLPVGTLNPFWERGELSELALFNSASTLSGVPMSNTFDRGREELVRRSIEMITTRGSIFTVYVLGQALEVTSVATNVVSSARMKQTFQVEPQFATADASDDNFNPASALSVASRFAAPTNFTINILASEVQETPQP